MAGEIVLLACQHTGLDIKGRVFFDRTRGIVQLRFSAEYGQPLFRLILPLVFILPRNVFQSLAGEAFQSLRLGHQGMTNPCIH